MNTKRKDTKPKRPRGRPSKLTPDAMDKIIEAIRAGNYKDVACEWAGVPQRTVRDWMKWGKERPDSEYGEFRRKVRTAEKAAEVQLVGEVRLAAKRDAKHAEWLLARRWPERWARTEKLEHSGRNGDPISLFQAQAQMPVNGDPVVAIARAFEILQRVGAAPKPGGENSDSPSLAEVE